MAFSTFSKEFTANMFTAVENQFIVKYLPQANGDAVRAYLYGLYLCNCKEEFDGESCAKILRIPYERFVEIFVFWEECDLVHILSRNPLFIEYLPVNAAVGKPKSVRPEKYAEFNRAFLRQLQRAGVDFKPYEMQRVLEFLENNPMEQQAFLLISEYCANKDGEKLTCNHILNKAKKLCSEYKYTYDQVERDLADFNTRERELAKIFSLLGISRKPQDGDYAYLDKWSEYGMETDAIYECAKTIKKGSLVSLDLLVAEMKENGLTAAAEVKEYLLQRNALADSVFAIARKLAVKIQNPRAYIDEYVKKWQERGYDDDALLTVASLCFKIGYGFPEMDALLDSLFTQGIVDGESVKQYCAAREKQLKLLQSVQRICGVIKKTPSALDTAATWQSWNFSDEMILEAARRSAGAAAPLPYMNKLLSEWKRLGIYSPERIPERAVEFKTTAYQNEAAIAADKRSDREHYYAVLRQKANERVEEAKKQARRSEAYVKADGAVKKCEIELAKAEVFSPELADSIKRRLEEYKAQRAAALGTMGLSEQDFIPRYACAKCSDSGFLPNGKACDCYRE